MDFRVLAIITEQGIIVIRLEEKIHKRIGMEWIKKRLRPSLKNTNSFPLYRTERVKFLIKEIKIEKIFWRHKITKKMKNIILNTTTKSKKIYDN